jgi:hypothetical protein
MQKQKALHSNGEAAGAIMKCRSSMRYTVMQKKQALHSNENVAGVKL